jgi:flagellar rod assembly protein/muramidase FlgJ
VKSAGKFPAPIVTRATSPDVTAVVGKGVSAQSTSSQSTIPAVDDASSRPENFCPPGGLVAAPAVDATSRIDKQVDDALPLRHASRVTRHDKENAQPQTLATSQQDFIAQLWPHAEAAGRELGVDPRTLIAHAALETGWGKNVPCNPDGTCSYNLFGVKATGRWHGAAVGVNTVEYQDGVAVRQRASFRSYDSPADSFRDYATLIKSSPRYAAAVGSGNDAAAFANALQQGGYATDPNYASKLAAVADRLDSTLKTTARQPLASGRSVSSGAET